jgi:hypothetical protein
MKSIDVKSLLIGFLLCAVGFFTIGATDNNGYGKYQVSTATFPNEAPVDHSGNDKNIYVTIIDTKDGSIHSLRKWSIINYHRP